MMGTNGSNSEQQYCKTIHLGIIQGNMQSYNYLLDIKVLLVCFYCIQIFILIIPAISAIVTSVAVTFVSICSGTVMLLVGLEEVFFLFDFFVQYIRGAFAYGCYMLSLRK